MLKTIATRNPHRNTLSSCLVNSLFFKNVCPRGRLYFNVDKDQDDYICHRETSNDKDQYDFCNQEVRVANFLILVAIGQISIKIVFLKITNVIRMSC